MLFASRKHEMPPPLTFSEIWPSPINNSPINNSPKNTFRLLFFIQNKCTSYSSIIYGISVSQMTTDMFHLKINMKWKYRCRATGKQTWTQIMKKNNLYNTPGGVRKWMREFRELNVDVGFETKNMKMERTRMLSSEGYIYIYHWIKVHRQIY